MSAAKRPRLSSQEKEEEGELAQVPAPRILVDLGNGVRGQLRLDGSGDSIVEERWQLFKKELYSSEVWQQCRDRPESSVGGLGEEASRESIEKEIQRAWDVSGKLEAPEAPAKSGTLKSKANACGVKEKSLKTNSSEVESAVEEKDDKMSQSGKVQRYLVTVEYAGTHFLGWQKQKKSPELRTVQGALEDAFNKFIGNAVVCCGSSRTDTGVHALGNVCHVDTLRVSKRKPGEYLQPHEPDVVERAVNHFLRKEGAGDMSITNVRCIPHDFHARFQAKERTYHYRILTGSLRSSVFERDRAWHISETLNVKAMQEAAQELIGLHDFSSFRAAGCQAKSPMKTLDELHICEMPAWPCFPSLEERLSASIGSDVDLGTHDVEPTKSKNEQASCSPVELKSCKPRCLVITARARSFLYHQVRLLVGTLKAVGCGVLTRHDVRRILDARSIKELLRWPRLMVCI